MTARAEEHWMALDRRAVVLAGGAAAPFERAVRALGAEPRLTDERPPELAGDDAPVLVGAGAARAFLAAAPGARVIAIAAQAELDAAFDALDAGAVDVLPPDPHRDELEMVLFPGARRSGVRDSSLLHGARLAELSAEVARIARALDGLTQDDAPAPPPDAPPAQPVTGGQVRGMIRARRAREQFFKGELFADPAWDILLDLTAARLEGKRVSVSSLCIAAAVPATTALRWIKSMTDGGLLERRPDPVDGRRVFIDLSDRASETMLAYLATARGQPPV